VHVNATNHRVGLTLHHIVADGWSLGVLVDDLMRTYKSLSTGRDPDLPPLPVSFADYAAWEEEWLRGETAERQLAYWRERLGGDLPVVDLPRDRPRPPVQTSQGGSVRRELSSTLSRQVEELSRKHAATPFMTLLTVFGLLLRRLTGLVDLPVGVPVAGRTRPQMEHLVGVFINTVVARLDLTGDPSFAELLQRTRSLAMEAYRNAELPIERVVEALRPRRDPGRTPLFQVLFNFIDMGRRRRIELPGLSVEVRGTALVKSKFDLTLYVGVEETTRLELCYNADLFLPERMEELLKQYVFLLEQAVADPDQAASAMSLQTPSSRVILPDPGRPQAEWTGPGATEAVAARARSQPDAPAIVDEDGVLDYAAVDRLSRALAVRLRGAGLSEGDRVALYAGRSADLAWGLLGILRAGAAFVILDPALPPARIAECLKAARPRAWLESPRLPPVAAEVSAILDDADLALRTGLSAAFLGPADHPDAGPSSAPGPEAVAYVSFTSGTTGGVKGIVGTHGPLAHFLTWHARTFGFDAKDRFSLLSGLSHDPALRDMLTPLHVGASLHIPESGTLMSPSELRAWLVGHGVTVVHLTPALAGVLLEGSRQGELPRVRYVFSGGDVLTPVDVQGLRRVAPAATIVNLYGATETPQAVGWHVVGDRDGLGPAQIPLGRGIDNAELLVLNDRHRLAGVGELGEIAVATPHLARGYLDDDVLTRDRFVPNRLSRTPGARLYLTGDWGRFRADGLVDFAGRRDGQVKVRGFRVEIEAVEAELLAHPAVRGAAVVVTRPGAAPGEPADAVLVACTTHENGDAPTATELRQFLRSRIPDYMVPSSFVTIGSIPLTTAGKVDRARVREMTQSSLPEEEADIPPRTAAEKLVAGIWQEALGVQSVSVHHNFFDLGGHSLLAVRVLARIEQQLGVRLNPRSMLYQTLEQFAAGLEGVQTPPVAPESQGPFPRLSRLLAKLTPGRRSEPGPASPGSA
jgi:amino acid adenylation domain-containing protein